MSRWRRPVPNRATRSLVGAGDFAPFRLTESLDESFGDEAWSARMQRTHQPHLRRHPFDQSSECPVCQRPAAPSAHRVRLNTYGSLRDLDRLPAGPLDGLAVTVVSDELRVTGIMRFSVEEDIWVAEIDWKDIVEIP